MIVSLTTVVVRASGKVVASPLARFHRAECPVKLYPAPALRMGVTLLPAAGIVAQ